MGLGGVGAWEGSGAWMLCAADRAASEWGSASRVQSGSTGGRGLGPAGAQQQPPRRVVFTCSRTWTLKSSPIRRRPSSSKLTQCGGCRSESPPQPAPPLSEPVS